jgi:membrane protein
MKRLLSSRPVRLIGAAIDGFVDHNDLTLAASISYYTALSLAPLLVLVLWLAASVSPDAQGELLGDVAGLVGSDARDAVQAIIGDAARKPSLGSVAGVFGVGLLIVGASAVFSQLQTALNIIWNTQPEVAQAMRRLFVTWLRRRLLAIGLLATFAFLLIVSLAISTLLELLLPREGALWTVVNQFVALIVFAALFAALFRYLPDRRLSWQDTLGGAIVTSLLFAIGKYAIEEYLSHSGIAGSYGPAGSFAVLLVWVYYSATIFLFGAECVRVFVAQRAHVPVPAAQSPHPSPPA